MSAERGGFATKCDVVCCLIYVVDGVPVALTIVDLSGVVWSLRVNSMNIYLVCGVVVHRMNVKKVFSC